MSKQVWKFPLVNALEPTVLQMPEGAVVKHVELQERVMCLWAEVDPAAPRAARIFHVFGTGWDIPGNPSYIGTVHDRSFVWHVYEEKENDI